MWKIIKMLLKFILFFIIILAIVFIGLLIHGTVTAYSPAEKETPITNGKGLATVGSNISILNWNIGYCGLGEEFDFFYDGGTKVFGSKEWADKNLNGINSILKENQNVDFVLLQEVDRKSKRSYKVDQVNEIEKVLPNFNSTFAINYKVGFLPYPFNQPLGKILGGLATYSKYQPIENIRYQFPGNYSWPKSNYFLQRCFLLQRFKAPNNKELIIINTHNSAYDSGGKLKKQQMAYMKDVLIEEYNKGNYVIVGGDWNQIPADFNNKTFQKTEAEYNEQIPVPADYLEGWQWVYDPATPTNRKLDKVYDENKTFTTIIDFYLLSPNIKTQSIKTIDTNFAYSDHQPVLLNVSLQ